MKLAKRGAMSPEVMVGLVLAVLFLVIVILIFKPVTSPKFTLGAKEQVCRQSLALSEGFKSLTLDSIKLRPICNTQVISFGEKDIMKQAKKGETAKDATARQILEYMQRCKDIVHGTKASSFLSGKSCYICYSLRTDATTPFLTAEDLTSYSVNLLEPDGERFFTALRQDDHSVVTYFPGGFGSRTTVSAAPSQKSLTLPKQYGVVYATFDKGSIAKILGTGVGVCASAASTWFVVGPIAGVIAAPVCKISLVTAGVTSLFELFQKKEEGVGAIMVTDYPSLDAYGCGTDVIS